MLSHKEPDKARHYLDLLDSARCNAQWQDIPELTRKVGKHAPHRQCLIHTAQTERLVAVHSSKRPTTPPTSTGLSQSIPLLVNAIEKEKTSREDAFQAQICLAWLYHTIGESENAASALPSGLEQASESLAKNGGITARWTHVCIIKGAFIRGFLLENGGNTKDALRMYESMLPYISNLPSTIANTPENQSWTERMLSRYCMLSSHHLTVHANRPQDLLMPNAIIPSAVILAPFRAYAKCCDVTTGARAGRAHSPSRVWRAYYDTLSVLLQNDMVQPIFHSKSQQRAELKSVEATYEAILLEEVSFPRADQVNAQVESWVDQVMANWRIMCGPTWLEGDLGKSDKAALGRGVLEILYRAATRTFHSTRVLRHLFVVHAALAEFYLASKAIDSYFEILVRGKARVEKSGEEEIGLDDDSTALGTAAAGIKMLCNYGRRKEVEKSLDIAKIVEGWLQKSNPDSSPKPVVSADDVPKDLVQQPNKDKLPVSCKALALGSHALGVSQSRWARMTYETSSRSELQDKALANFRAALKPEWGEGDNIEILYSFAFVLAETRDIDTAIAIIKQALSIDNEGSNVNGIATADFALDDVETNSDTDLGNRGLLLRSWHLLALLLSARQDFSTAIASCEAALDLYGSKSILYGDSRHLDASTLAFSERKDIIEIKITHIALSEVIDGPEEAVNSSRELLGLYTKLFEHVQKPVPKLQEPSQSPPSSANGTLSSLRGSILGLPKDSRLKFRKTGNVTGTTSSSLQLNESLEEDAHPPTISVTSHDGPASRDSNHLTHFVGRQGSNKLHKKHSRKSVGSRLISRPASPSRPPTSDGTHNHHLHLNLPFRSRHEDSTKSNGSAGTSYNDNNEYAAEEVGVAISHDLPSLPSTPAASSDPPNPLHNIPSTTQNMDHRNPNTYPAPPKPPSPQPRSLSTPPSSLPTVPEPHYPPQEQTRHALTLLTKIWLVIAGLYRRASMPLDAQGALSEATTHVQSIETAIASLEGSSATTYTTPGYGGLKACWELWADVLADQGALHVQMGDAEAASEAFESALGRWPDHVAATIGLCNLLLDEYSAPPPTTNSSTPAPDSVPPSKSTLAPLPSPPTIPSPSFSANSTDEEQLDLLSRLAARDRAHELLSALTKSGAGWDCSEAWFALSRAYECGGEVGRAEEALWWVVELEEGRGVREWGCLGGS